VEVHGARVHYAEAGSGDPVVLLHGWPQNWWSWREVLPQLATSYRVICPDIRGLGWSDGSSRSYRLRELARDLVGLMDELQIPQARLVGHDWGSAIGYTACLEHPERFQQFVAVAGLPPWASEGGPMGLWLRTWHVFVLGILGGITATRVLPMNSLRTWRHRGAFSEAEVELYLGRIRTPTGAHATHSYYRNIVFREFPNFLLHHSSMRLTVPTLHLNGERDPLTKGVSDSWRRYSDDMRLELIEDCGHFIPEEHPAELAERIVQFFDAASRSHREGVRHGNE
jgi:pimeloyl-ACP methyl ester carboxylesterase